MIKLNFEIGDAMDIYQEVLSFHQTKLKEAHEKIKEYFSLAFDLKIDIEVLANKIEELSFLREEIQYHSRMILSLNSEQSNL